MEFLGRKPKVDIEGFCQQFYDSRYFPADTAGEGAWSSFLETAFNFVADLDRSFAITELAVFRREMIALCLELFGLAWVYRFKQSKLGLLQCIFTRRYLEGKGQFEIWNTMREYNKDCARSVFLTKTGEELQGRVGTVRVVFVNSFRFGIFKECVSGDPSAPTEEEVTLAECASCVASRMLVEDRNLVKLLTTRPAGRLNYDLNPST